MGAIARDPPNLGLRGRDRLPVRQRGRRRVRADVARSRSTRSWPSTSIAGSQVTRKSTAWFDLFGAVRIADGLDLRVRPVVFRRAFDGAWQTQMYELALRYERPGADRLSHRRRAVHVADRPQHAREPART